MKSSENFDELLKALGKPSLFLPLDFSQQIPAWGCLSIMPMQKRAFLFFENGMPDFQQHGIVGRSSWEKMPEVMRRRAHRRYEALDDEFLPKQTWYCYMGRGWQNIINVKDISRPVLISCVPFLRENHSFHRLSSMMKMLLGLGQFNWVIQLCCSVSSRWSRRNRPRVSIIRLKVFRRGLIVSPGSCWNHSPVSSFLTGTFRHYSGNPRLFWWVHYPAAANILSIFNLWRKLVTNTLINYSGLQSSHKLISL